MALKPPKGYNSWLDFAVERMDTRDLFECACLDEATSGESWWGRVPERDDMRQAAREELAALRKAPSHD